jgi:antitoxin MazE
MKVARWGNSLAVRLPRSHVEALGLREGDEVEIAPEAIRKLGDDRDARRAAALRRMEELSRPGPPGYNFDRDEIYDSMLSRSEAGGDGK